MTKDVLWGEMIQDTEKKGEEVLIKAAFSGRSRLSLILQGTGDENNTFGCLSCLEAWLFGTALISHYL